MLRTICLCLTCLILPATGYATGFCDPDPEVDGKTLEEITRRLCPRSLQLLSQSTRDEGIRKAIRACASAALTMQRTRAEVCAIVANGRRAGESGEAAAREGGAGTPLMHLQDICRSAFGTLPNAGGGYQSWRTGEAYTTSARVPLVHIDRALAALRGRPPGTRPDNQQTAFERNTLEERRHLTTELTQLKERVEAWAGRVRSETANLDRAGGQLASQCNRIRGDIERLGPAQEEPAQHNSAAYEITTLGTTSAATSAAGRAALAAGLSSRAAAAIAGGPVSAVGTLLLSTSPANGPEAALEQRAAELCRSGICGSNGLPLPSYEVQRLEQMEGRYFRYYTPAE